jgi:hypothetical protein
VALIKISISTRLIAGDALRRRPLMYGLGIGRMNAQLTNLFNAVGWQSFPVPFYFRVESP